MLAKDTKKPHILTIPSWYKQSGNPLSGSFFFDQARALVNNGFTVGVIFTEKVLARDFSCSAFFSTVCSLRTFKDAGIQTVRMKRYFLPVAEIASQFWIRSILLLFREYSKRYGRPDVVHAQSALYGGIAAQLIKKDAGVPYIITEHASFIGMDKIESWKKNLVSSAYRNADCVCAVSNHLADNLKQHYLLSAVTVVPNVVDTNFFRLPPTRRTKVPFEILSVCYFEQNKNLSLLIEAFSDAFRDRTDVVLKIGGDGAQRSALKSLVEKSGVKHLVTFTGVLSRSEVRDAMWHANAYVLTSNYETFGVVLIEASATGLPVISTACGGPSDILTDDLGILTPVNNVKELSSAMNKLVSKETAEIGTRGEDARRHYIVSKFSEPQFCKSIAACYERALGAAPGL